VFDYPHFPSSHTHNGDDTIPRYDFRNVPHITFIHTQPAMFANIPGAFATGFALINGGFLIWPIELSVDKQTLLVITSDGTNVLPVVCMKIMKKIFHFSYIVLSPPIICISRFKILGFILYMVLSSFPTTIGLQTSSNTLMHLSPGIPLQSYAIAHSAMACIIHTKACYCFKIRICWFFLDYQSERTLFLPDTSPSRAVQ